MFVDWISRSDVSSAFLCSMRTRSLLTTNIQNSNTFGRHGQKWIKIRESRQTWSCRFPTRCCQHDYPPRSHKRDSEWRCSFVVFESRQQIEAWVGWSIIFRDMAGKRRTLKTSTGHRQRSSSCSMRITNYGRSREDGVKDVSMRRKDVHATLSRHFTSIIWISHTSHASMSTLDKGLDVTPTTSNSSAGHVHAAYIRHDEW